MTVNDIRTAPGVTIPNGPPLVWRNPNDVTATPLSTGVPIPVAEAIKARMRWQDGVYLARATETRFTVVQTVLPHRTVTYVGKTA